MRTSYFASERGSLPTTLLVTIILGGLIAALFTVVRSSQVSASRDRDVNQSIQVADAGVQEAFVRLVEIDDDSDTGDPLFAAVGETTDVVNGEVGEGDYTWQARRIGQALWEVRSVGRYRTHESVVESQMGLVPMFFYALWGDSENGITAGNAEIGHLEGGAPAMGSNGPITLHNFLKALVPDNLVVECHGDNAAANCTGINGADLIPGNLEFKDLGSLAYAPRAPGAEVGGECWDEASNQEINQGRFTGQFPLIGGQTYCFSQVTWPQGGPPFQLTPGPGGQTRVNIYINPVPQDGDPEASLLVGGTGTANASIVNWEPVSTSDPMMITTSAANLIIRAGGTRPVEFRNNNSRIAAGIYAPLARCEIRAQVTVVGSMICGEVPTTGPGSASGGWRLYYDPALEDLMVDGVYRIRQWVQESCSASSFPWGGPTC